TYIFAGLVIHNSKVVGSSPTPATISSIDSKTYVDNSLLRFVDLNDESFIYSVHVGRKLVRETVGATTPRSRAKIRLELAVKNEVWARITPEINRHQTCNSEGIVRSDQSSRRRNCAVAIHPSRALG